MRQYLYEHARLPASRYGRERLLNEIKLGKAPKEWGDDPNYLIPYGIVAGRLHDYR